MSVPDAENMLLKYFAQSNGKQIIAHQIESFNQFIEYDIPDIIHRVNPIKVRGSPEIPLSSHRHNIGLTTSAANSLAETTDDIPVVVPISSSVARYEYEVNIEFLDAKRYDY